MSRVRLVLHQFRYDYRTYVRASEAIFFTAFLPLMFLVLFVGVFGNDDIPTGAGRFVSGATYYVPSILALSVISSTALSLAVSLAIARERGTLKRLRSTPLPPSTYLIARVLTQLVAVLLISALVLAFGRVVYGVRLPPSSWPALIVTLSVGIGAFCCVGFLMSLTIRSENTAGVVPNAIFLPLQFMSGIFFPRGTIPLWMRDVATLFPIKHLVDAMFTVFDPTHVGSRLSGDHLAVLSAWGVGSLIVAARFFRWTPTNR